MNTHEVIVGNVGVVYVGGNRAKAHSIFTEYVHQSLSGYGRAAGEEVVWLKDGEEYRFHRCCSRHPAKPGVSEYTEDRLCA